MSEHKNLFQFHRGPTEVYKSLQRDYASNSRELKFWDLLAVGCMLWLTRDLPTWDWLAALGLYAAAATGLRTFLDNSNRNFLMHHLDWSIAQQEEQRSHHSDA